MTTPAHRAAAAPPRHAVSEELQADGTLKTIADPGPPAEPSSPATDTRRGSRVETPSVDAP